MDATCAIQASIHVFNLVRKYVSRILGTYLSGRVFFIGKVHEILYSVKGIREIHVERVEQKMDQHVYEEYIAILKEELVPALGCTEPIAIAYAAAKAREILGKLPEEIVVSCSGNIIKNVKAVIVPTTGDLKGIETSAILGAVGGNAEKKLEVLVDVTDEDLKITRELLKRRSVMWNCWKGIQSADYRRTEGW